MTLPPVPLAVFSLLRALLFLKTAAIFILAFALVFGLLAFCHEFGHFITAKMLGMSVDQFGIGFPPTQGWTIMRRSGTSYTLHPIPLGAFVKIRGMDPTDQDAPNSFMRQPPWARLIVLAAGSAANMLLAVVIFILMGMTTGLPGDYVTNQVKEVTHGSAADKAGIKPGDTILAVRQVAGPPGWTYPVTKTHAPTDAIAMVAVIHGSFKQQVIAGKKQAVGLPLQAKIQRPNGPAQTITATPAIHSKPDGTPYAALGYTPGTGTEYKRLSWSEAVGNGIDNARLQAHALVSTLSSMIIELFQRKITPAEFGSNFQGPVQIASNSGNIIQQGLPSFLGFIGWLSINIGVINLMPLPIFDGGNILLVLLEVVRRKQLDPAQFMIVQLVGLVFILTLMVYLTYHDIVRVAHGGG